ncbi:MAG: HoxN/HupN/NixA family nickel/cobalt transporter [Rhodanobacter sp.]
MLVLLLCGNAAAWWWAMAEGRHEPLFLGSCLLAYGFGLRHAFDADHIAAIDNVTRSLARDMGAPVTVGLWFALGHSTVVVSACALVALMVGQPQAWLPRLVAWGSLGGSLFSVLFLCAAAGINAASLPAMLCAWRRGSSCNAAQSGPRGLLAAAVGAVTQLVSRPWHMLLVGLLFGLGFDTASEVGLLGLSASTALHMPSQASIMILPVLFTVGMSLADASDGAIMARAYSWATELPQRRLTYNLVVTSLSVLAAVIVAAVELGDLVRQKFSLRGMVWRFIAWTCDHSELVGVLIFTTLLGSWLVVLLGRLATLPSVVSHDVSADRLSPYVNPYSDEG